MRQAVIQKTEERQRRQQPNLTGIPTQMKMDFEQRSGMSFDDVRVHYNSDKPRKIGALAYTQIPQVYIGPGQERHLRHELGHVVQQKSGIVRPTTWINGLPVNDSAKLESEVENNSLKMTSLIPRIAKQNETIQRFHIVIPDQVSGLNGDTPITVSANRIIHHKPGAEQDGAMTETDAENGSVIFPELKAQIDQAIEKIRSIELRPQATTTPELTNLYAHYFQLVGRLSHPQLPGKYLGENLYSSDPKSPLKNRLVPALQSKYYSTFTLHFVESALDHPLLVSDKLNFAVTAIFGEPKEVFLSDSAKADVERRINPSIPFKATGAKIKILGNQLSQYKVHWEPDTTECDKVYQKVKNPNIHFKEALLRVLDLNDKITPWKSHFAAKIAVDGDDVLTLENGSRWSWLYRGYLETLMGKGGDAYTKFNVRETQDKIVKPLNNSWYFRIYGPESSGQDMKSQITNRFTPYVLPSDKSEEVEGTDCKSEKRTCVIM